MNRKLIKTLRTSATFILGSAFLATGFAAYIVRRSWPQETGTIQVPGLQEKVEVLRDAWGIPHLYATNPHDLFFAQGYIHAQDRFWQMDFGRHLGSGRLAEMFGQSQVATDKMLRPLGWARVAEQELALMEVQAQAHLQAYASGVNAYLATHPGRIGLEYTILGLKNPDYQPEPWTPIHTLTWLKVMAWNLDGNQDAEIRNVRLIQRVGKQMWRDYEPLSPADAPIIVPKASLGLDSRALGQLLSRVDQLNTFLGGRRRGLGSNSWVISGARTTTGSPLLANDPHLGIQMPSIWYENGLHCRPKSASCPFSVTGFSFAAMPGVIIGHNDRIAWGMTNVGADMQDLYIEKINQANPNQYQVNGQWVDMQLVPEVIHVAGGKDVPLTVRYTRHGPAISDVNEGYTQLNKTTGLNLPPKYAIALRWTALAPTLTWQAIWKMNQATNFKQFREALRDFGNPSLNLVYADVNGNIGYQMTGNIPIRAKGDGLLPVPGWTDKYKWTGVIPFEKLPYSYNPPQGYIVTANNAVVGSAYPYPISYDWDRGYRAQRIVEMIKAQVMVSMKSMQQMQGDNKSLLVPIVLPYLFALDSGNDPKLRAALESLRTWDYQAHLDSQPTAIFNAFWTALMAKLFADQLPADLGSGGGDNQWLAVTHLLAEPDNPWWDNAQTADKVETRDDILRAALAAGIADLETRLGTDQRQWTWGALHTSTFKHQPFGEFRIGVIRSLFNRGPVPTSGGTSIVNATGWSTQKPYHTISLPSMRTIVDLGNLNNSLAMHTTGQSGHAFHPHYDDMIEPWRQIQYHSMPWDRSAVKAGAAAHLTLMP